ncbi:MAG: hypothetical protein KKH01_04915 [Firmicutes bacterium]|nr:hypothetical protein [Bacillota bacterium]
MKKMILFILLSCLLTCSIQFDSKAEETASFPIGKNYLDLSNLVMKPGDSGYAYTKNPILVKANHQYTIVFDYGFLGQHADWLGDIYVGIEEDLSHDSYELLILDDYAHLRAYVEFIPQEAYIHITDLPMLPDNYDAILYEGFYTDFPGFEPFINQNEQMTYQGVLLLDYDQLLTTEQIQSYIHSTDPDGNTISFFTESDEYSSSAKLPGTYQMVFMTTYNQIAKRYYLDVRVYDQSAPVIVDPGTISIPLSEKASLNDVKQMIDVSDNVDDLTSDDLLVLADTYSTATAVGSYSITFKAVDSSLNETTLTIEINLVDLNGPVITGPSEIYLYTSDTPLTTQQIKDFYTFIDDVDGENVEVIFTVDTYEQTQIEGVYGITMQAYDTQLNYRIMNIKIHVIENRGPIFTNDEMVLDVDTADAMTEQDIIDWFVDHTLSMGLAISHVRVLYNEYENHEDEDGNYYIYLNYLVDGQEETSRIRVDVVEMIEDVNYTPYILIGIPSIGGLVTLFILKRKNK